MFTPILMPQKCTQGLCGKNNQKSWLQGRRTTSLVCMEDSRLSISPELREEPSWGKVKGEQSAKCTSTFEQPQVECYTITLRKVAVGPSEITTFFDSYLLRITHFCIYPCSFISTQVKPFYVFLVIAETIFIAPRNLIGVNLCKATSFCFFKLALQLFMLNIFRIMLWCKAIGHIVFLVTHVTDPCGASSWFSS